TSIAGIRSALSCKLRDLPSGAWLQATRYDDARLSEGRHPNRRDLDAVSTHHPIRLRHRGLHLDVLNTAALRTLELADSPAMERDAETGEPTGRLFHAGEAIAQRTRRLRRPDVRASVRQASQRLLSTGVTSVQDASVTNGPEQWALFQMLSEAGDFGPRLFMLPGYRSFHELTASPSTTPLVRQAQVKLMINEMDANPDELRAAVADVCVAGRSVAIHAATEAELVLALDAFSLLSFRGIPGALAAADASLDARHDRMKPAGPNRQALPDRIEHGSAIPDALLPRLREAGVTVVGNPAWLCDRSDVYEAFHEPEVHGWLHRARSLLAAGIPYAAGSDAPVVDPNPMLSFFALHHRQLGVAERLSPDEALAAITHWPASAVGAGHELGRLRPGAIADVVVLDRDPEAWQPGDPSPVRMTIVNGRVAWRR
ncbi:MAG: amidohydrolase, partial [Chloroflexota bacterium]